MSIMSEHYTILAANKSSLNLIACRAMLLTNHLIATDASGPDH